MAKKKPSKKQAGKPPPKCKAILLCQQTLIDASSGNIALIGIFSTCTLPSFPDNTRPFEVYVQLVDGIGRYDIAIEVQDLRDTLTVVRVEGIGIEFPERLERINLRIRFPPLLLQHAGSYDVVVFANEQEIDRQQFRAVSEEDSGGNGDGFDPHEGLFEH